METGGFDGGILKVKRRPFLPRAEAPRKPFDQGIHGRLDSMDLKDMCASIFGPHYVVPESVRFRRLQYTDRLLDEYITGGPDLDLDPFVVSTAPRMDEEGEAAEGGDDGAGGDSDNGGLVADSTSEADFLGGDFNASSGSEKEVLGDIAQSIEVFRDEMVELMVGYDADEVHEYESLLKETDACDEVDTTIPDPVPPANKEDADSADEAGDGLSESSDDEMPLHDRRRYCLEIFPDVHNSEQLCNILQLAMENWKVKDLITDERLGRLNVIQGRTLAGTCGKHGPGCKLWVNYKTKRGLEYLEAELVKWFARGSCTSEAQHKADAEAIKAAWRTQDDYS